MQIEQLIKMVNQIETFCRSEYEGDAAVAAVRDHLERFWDPRMRLRIAEYVREGGVGLNEIAVEAVRTLRPVSSRWSGMPAAAENSASPA